MSCLRCGAPFIAYGSEQATTVGSLLFMAPGHNHDDNCLTRRYTCAAGHGTTFALVRRCPACSCRACGAVFVDQWPAVSP